MGQCMILCYTYRYYLVFSFNEQILFERAHMVLYTAILQDHYQNPRHYGPIENAEFISAQKNTSCGDTVTVYGIIKDGLVEVSFEGSGCMLSQAATSLLLDFVYRKPLAELKKFTKDDFTNLLGMQLGPNRLLCALTGFEALKKGLNRA